MTNLTSRLEAPTLIQMNSSTVPETFHDSLIKPISLITQTIIPQIIAIILFSIFTYQCFRYFTSDLPPSKSNLKPLPGPRSTLPYIGRVHDVDRMHAWNSMHKFSKEYNGLFSCTLGGETHIWVAREDVAQDLLCKNAAICSARADLGAYPGVTKDYKYLPLMGYTGVSFALLMKA